MCRQLAFACIALGVLVSGSLPASALTKLKPRSAVVPSGSVMGGARALTITRQFWTNEPGTVYGYGPGNYIVGPFGMLYGPYPLDDFRRR